MNNFNSLLISKAVLVGSVTGAVTGGVSGALTGNFILPGAGIGFGGAGGSAAGGYCGAKGTEWFCDLKD